jgi:dihydrofolate reductase
MKIRAILAMDSHRLIGAKNGLPWHIPEDMKRFRLLTSGQIVIMGKNTYTSLPDGFRPLPNRRNIVISREGIDGVESFASIEACLDTLRIE